MSDEEDFLWTKGCLDEDEVSECLGLIGGVSVDEWSFRSGKNLVF